MLAAVLAAGRHGVQSRRRSHMVSVGFAAGGQDVWRAGEGSDLGDGCDATNRQAPPTSTIRSRASGTWEFAHLPAYLRPRPSADTLTKRERPDTAPELEPEFCDWLDSLNDSDFKRVDAAPRPSLPCGGRLAAGVHLTQDTTSALYGSNPMQSEMISPIARA